MSWYGWQKKLFVETSLFHFYSAIRARNFLKCIDSKSVTPKEWNLNLIVQNCPPLETIDQTLPPASRSAARKTEALKILIKDQKLEGVIAGIRRDEEGTRAKERVFSPRSQEADWNFKNQPPEFWDQYKTSFPPGTHVRIHPLLAWTCLLYTSDAADE